MSGDATCLSLASILGEGARRYPQRTAVVDREREVTYTQLWREALARARSLRQSAGIEPGDRVALVAANGVSFVAEYFAILALGAVVVPMAPMLVADEIEFQLRDSQARAVVLEAEFVEAGRQAAERAAVRWLVPSDELSAADDPGAADRLPEPRAPLDPAVVFYTSGTTGRPKGAVLTHFNLVMNCFVNAFMANRFEPDDVVLGCLPLFHTFGQTVAMNSSFLVGAKVVLQRRFEAREALELMRRHGVTFLLGVPTMYIALLEALGSDPPVRLRACVSGGAPLPVPVLEAFERTFGCRVKEGYGLSETSPTATVNQDLLGHRPGSIGHPLWGVEVEIARAEIEERIELLGVDELGEIVIRGHNVFEGYFAQPAATRASVVDGWFRTGDLGVKDPDGFLHVVDRKKDMILRGGYNVYPREIEEVLARHPAVMQVAVVGVPDQTLGEEVLAVVVPGPAGESLTPEELTEWMQPRIARHKQPRIIQIVEELPLGPTGKVLRREIRATYQSRGLAEASVAAPDERRG